MSNAQVTALPPTHMLKPGTKVKIMNKRNEPEPEGTVLLHDKIKMNVLVEMFHPERGTTTWWLPDYMVIPIEDAKESTDAASG